MSTMAVVNWKQWAMNNPMWMREEVECIWEVYRAEVEGCIDCGCSRANRMGNQY
jgi:hypothetical protein